MGQHVDMLTSHLSPPQCAAASQPQQPSVLQREGARRVVHTCWLVQDVINCWTQSHEGYMQQLQSVGAPEESLSVTFRTAHLQSKGPHALPAGT